MKFTMEQIRNIAKEIMDQFKHQDVLDVDDNASISMAMENGSKIVTKLNYDSIQKIIIKLIYDDLIVEDRLNEEVREILEQYQDEIDDKNLEYSSLFKMIKRKLVKERGLVL